jgi:signal transduction histidine kinase
LWAVVNALIFGLSTLLLLPYSSLFGEALAFDLVSATAASSALMAGLASALQSLIVRRARISAATQALNATLRDAVAAMDARIEMLRKNVSRHFHNQVQAKIVALALKLSAEPEYDEGVRNQTVTALDDLERALEVAEQEAQPLELQLADLAEFWQGALELDSQIAYDARTRIDSDANLVARVVEVVREGLTNAAKHSTDGKVSLNIDLDGSQVRLRMSNARFDGLETLAPTGIGAATIGEASSWFTRHSEGDTFVLEARFE